MVSESHPKTAETRLGCPTSVKAGVSLLALSVASALLPVLLDPSRVPVPVLPQDPGLTELPPIPYWLVCLCAGISAVVSFFLLRATFSGYNWARYVLLFLYIPSFPYSREALSLLMRDPFKAFSVAAAAAGLVFLFLPHASRWFKPQFRAVVFLEDRQ